MFTFGTLDTEAIPRLEAVLQTWPTLAGLAVETVEAPGRDGAFFAAQQLGQAVFAFDLTATATTPAAVMAIAAQIAGACAPGRGLQPLTLPDIAPGWQWQAVAAQEVQWQRGLWMPGAQCTLKATLTFQCPDPYGYAVPDETATGVTSATITRTKGNCPSWPRIEITGAFAGVNLTIGGRPVGVTGVNLTAGETLVLDYADLDFAVWSGGVKLRHVAGGMSTLQRFSVPVGEAVIVNAAAISGSVSSVMVRANSRRC